VVILVRAETKKGFLHIQALFDCKNASSLPFSADHTLEKKLFSWP
jgi:hypothetical protein